MGVQVPPSTRICEGERPDHCSGGPFEDEQPRSGVCVRVDAIDVDELRELLVDAWRMYVPKKLAAAYDG